MDAQGTNAGDPAAALSRMAGQAAGSGSSRSIVPQAVGLRAENAAPGQPAPPTQPAPTELVGSRPVPAGLQGRMMPPPPVLPARNAPVASSPLTDVVGGKRPAGGPADAGRAAKRYGPGSVCDLPCGMAAPDLMDLAKE